MILDNSALSAQRFASRTSPVGCGAGAGVDSTWKQTRSSSQPEEKRMIPVIVRDALLGVFVLPYHDV